MAGVAGCASVSPPPGGIQTKIPPMVVSVVPDSGATNVKLSSVEFRFDKVVSNPLPGGDNSLNQLFVVSPTDGTPRVSWHRDRIDVRPRHGFRPNTAYAVTMLPGVADLRSNVSKTSRTVIFSTGPTIPPLGILGRAFDWASGSPVSGAWVQALPVTDTNTVYLAQTDSGGQFSLGPLSAGRYIVRGFVDQDRNRALGRHEKWDADTLTLTDARPAIELDLIERDTVPPRIATIQATDSVTLTIAFDMALDSASIPGPANVRVVRSDSVPLTVTRVETAEALQQTHADSVRRADSASAAKAPPSPRADTSAGIMAMARPAQPPRPKPREPAPSRTLVVHLSPTTPLVVERQYLVTVTGLRNLLGRGAPTSRVFLVPKPEPRPTQPPATRKPVSGKPPRR